MPWIGSSPRWNGSAGGRPSDHRRPHRLQPPDRRAAADRRVWRRAAGRHRGCGHGQDQGHRRAGQVPPRHARRPSPGADPGPHLQRQGRQGAPGPPGPAVGPAIRARMPVSNFHSFCHRILAEYAAEAGLQAEPGRARRHRAVPPAARHPAGTLPLVYHAGTDWTLAEIRPVHQPREGRARHARRLRGLRRARARRLRGAVRQLRDAADASTAQGNLRGPREVRKRVRRLPARGARRGARRGRGDLRPRVDREDRRPRGSSGRRSARAASRLARSSRTGATRPDRPARRDATSSTAPRSRSCVCSSSRLVYRAYQEELAARGALDFGEQIAAVTQLLQGAPERAAPLPAPVPLHPRRRVPGREHRPDRAHRAARAHAGPARQRHGRRRRRPVDLPLPGRQLRRLQPSSIAASRSRRPTTRPRRRPARRPASGSRRTSARSRPCSTVANRLIERNETRYEPDKRLRPSESGGEPVELIICAGPEDEAVGDRRCDPRLRRRPGDRRRAARWSDIAVLYRKHKHREAIVARLRDEGIPYTVVGGLSLFETPEIRDLEQSLRAIADPHQDIALVRMMSAGPWRLDALEILQSPRMARYDRRHLIEVVREIVDRREIDRSTRCDERLASPRRAGGAAVDRLVDCRRCDHARQAPPPARRARRADAETWREGPFTVLERYVERTGQVLDLIAVDTLESKRIVANIASFLRFAADWQQAHPNGTLAGFVDYLDAYQAAGGELPTSVELTEDVEGVRLMTLYQAKGLEFPIVFVPQLLEGRVADARGLAAAVPQGPAARVGPRGRHPHRGGASAAVRRADPRAGSARSSPPRRTDGEEGTVAVRRRAARGRRAGAARRRTGRHVTIGAGEDGASTTPMARVESTSPAPRSTDPRAHPAGHAAADRRASGGWRCALRAIELLGMLEGTIATDPEAPAARARSRRSSPQSAMRPTDGADEARARGLDPLTLRDGRAGQRGRCEPAPGRAAAARVQLFAVLARTSAARSGTPSGTCTGSRRAGRAARLLLRHERPRCVRGVHEGAPRAPGPRRTARRPARISSGCSWPVADRRSATRPPRRPTSDGSGRCSTTSGGRARAASARRSTRSSTSG